MREQKQAPESMSGHNESSDFIVLVKWKALRVFVRQRLTLLHFRFEGTPVRPSFRLILRSEGKRSPSLSGSAERAWSNSG